MERVGVRELKANLSRYLRLVRSGARLVITERGLSVAIITPFDVVGNVAWADQMVAQARARWNGRKPKGSSEPVTAKSQKSASSIVLEDRR